MRIILLCLLWPCSIVQAQSLKVLNFQADNGYAHESKATALLMVEQLGQLHGWTVHTSSNPATLHPDSLADVDVIVFNNNCGTERRMFTDGQQSALQAFIRGGGGFVGIHCAGAIWHEGGTFQSWYEALVGTRLIAHPEVKPATLVVEDHQHNCTAHLPKRWTLTDEWHIFSENPRPRVKVLLSLDEASYEADTSLKMGDHPFTWYQYYDGGRSFFCSIGHTVDVYLDPHYQQLIAEGIKWAGTQPDLASLNLWHGLLLDLNADVGVDVTAEQSVVRWRNQMPGSLAEDFEPQVLGRRLMQPESGRPIWQESQTELNGHRSIAFREDELINQEEDAFDHLMTGHGYTWLAVVKPYETADPEGKTEFGLYRLRDVNSFLGNLRNGGNYEGIWGCLDDDLTFWGGTRNGITFGRFDANNPKVVGPQLEANRFYVLAGRMEAGTDTVQVDMFVNSARSIASARLAVNPEANPSKLAIGTERDATNHPGSESFDGEIARVLMYERPLSDEEMQEVIGYLRGYYGLGK